MVGRSKGSDNFAIDCEQTKKNEFACKFENPDKDKKGKVKMHATKDGKLQPKKIQFNENVTKEERDRLEDEVLEKVSVAEPGQSNDPSSDVLE